MSLLDHKCCSNLTRVAVISVQVQPYASISYFSAPDTVVIWVSCESISHIAFSVSFEDTEDTLIDISPFLLAENSLRFSLEKLDTACLIVALGERRPWKSGPRVGKQAVMIEAPHSTYAQMKALSASPVVMVRTV